jgi:hypothetical protein
MIEPVAETPVRGPSLLPAVALLTLALWALCGFLLYQAIVERNALTAAKAAQDQPLQHTQQVKAQLAALATATAKLADQGNAGAKQIIESMQREGITVKP